MIQAGTESLYKETHAKDTFACHYDTTKTFPGSMTFVLFLHIEMPNIRTQYQAGA